MPDAYQMSPNLACALDSQWREIAPPANREELLGIKRGGLYWPDTNIDGAAAREAWLQPDDPQHLALCFYKPLGRDCAEATLVEFERSAGTWRLAGELRSFDCAIF